MSRENVELQGRAFETFNRRDFDGFLALMDPEVEFVPYERALEGGGAYHGHSGVRRWWSDYSEALADFTAEFDEVRDLGDVTLTCGRLRGHGAGSGASFERTLWHVARWRGGKTLWWRAFDTEAEALEAVGLREHGDRA
jgi:ketosteroid isomerase-like protein